MIYTTVVLQIPFNLDGYVRCCGIDRYVGGKFMKTNIFFSLLLVIIFLNSCIENRINENLEIYGYSIGDTITEEFKITHKYGEYFSDAIFKKDTLVEIYTIGKQINTFTLNLSETEFNETIKRVEFILGKPIVYYIGDTIRKIKLNHSIEYFLWNDSITNKSIEAYLNMNYSRKGYVRFSNDSISEILLRKHILDYDVIDKPVEIVECE